MGRTGKREKWAVLNCGKEGRNGIEEWRVTEWEDTWREIRQMQKTDGTDSELNFYERLGGGKE